MTGVGKSILGGIILEDKEIFTSEDPSEDGTEACFKGSKTINGQLVVVIDTPGLSKQGPNQELVVKEIKRSIKLAEPGPHSFLFVEKFQKITRDKIEALQVFQDTFGKEVMARTVVVFTTDEEVNKDEVKKRIASLTEQPDQACFAFNIDDMGQQKSRVKELLEKITEMKKKQKSIYTPKMLQEAEKTLKHQQKKPRTEEQWSFFYDRFGLYGTIVGSVAGYFICGGKLTPSTGAALGAVAGMILFMGIAFLVVLAKIKLQTCCK
uniref:AIG1-type G domain-containing protein n=1 Tax=Amphilophus citrinellus TaxID=61819 RepID=A0A3Q0R2X5_AMPCI